MLSCELTTFLGCVAYDIDSLLYLLLMSCRISRHFKSPGGCNSLSRGFTSCLIAKVRPSAMPMSKSRMRALLVQFSEEKLVPLLAKGREEVSLDVVDGLAVLLSLKADSRN